MGLLFNHRPLMPCPVALLLLLLLLLLVVVVVVVVVVVGDSSPRCSPAVVCRSRMRNRLRGRGHSWKRPRPLPRTCFPQRLHPSPPPLPPRRCNALLGITASDRAHRFPRETLPTTAPALPHVVREGEAPATATS